jgi:putative ABC transport system ATP-binding protein
MPAILTATNLVKTFGSGESAVHAVADVSLEVQPGELILIKGPSGSGKTTLLSILGGLMRADAGEVSLSELELTALGEGALADMRARKIGFVFQAYNLLGALNVEENILFPARLVPGHYAKAKRQSGALMERLGLAHRAKAHPHQLSGGEKQRVAVARALINDPPLILADEPTGNLDSERGSEVAMLLHDIARDDNRAVVIVTHDQRIEDIADRILWLEDGKIRDRKQEPHEWTKDPVCGMRVDRWVAKNVADYEDTAYAFCSKRCREKFLTEPGKYAVPAA